MELEEVATRAATMTLSDLVRMIASYDARIGEADAALAQLKAERALLEELALPMFAQEGIQNVKLSDLQRTVYLHRSFYASVIAETSAELPEVLDEMGMGELAPRTIHPSRLRALVKEWVETAGEVPEQIAPFITHGERYSVRSRKA